MKNVTHSHFFSFIFLTFLISSISSQPCLKTCGNQPLNYPFGSGPGCGDPRFQQYITCKDQTLTLTTHTGSYPVTDIDYDSQTLHVTDPSMSTCSCTQPSKGFGLDSNAPFALHDDNIFALLDCSVTSSPIYSNGSVDAVTLCDTSEEGKSICSFLNTCQAISIRNLPISTCCVYTPVDLGPAYDMELDKLKCSSYSGIYSFDGQEARPENWKFGIAVKYKFNVYNDFPGVCRDCERSNGVCGYSGTYDSFVCVCPSGNSTTDCFFGAAWSKAASNTNFLPSHIGVAIVYALAWYLVSAVHS